MGCSQSAAADKPGEATNSPQKSENRNSKTDVANVPNTNTASPSKKSAAVASSKNMGNRASFGAGCYWGTEKFFFHNFNNADSTDGKITKGSVGFMGPTDAPSNPTYKDVCTGTTGHVEVYDCEFTGGMAFYEKMVRFFFQFHDPTILNKQGNDKGTQYASVIYCYSVEQEEIAVKVIAQLQELLNDEKLKPYIENEVKTDVRRATDFFPAQKEHQDYLMNNPNGYCNHRIRFKEWPAR
jgi:peptide-methionine (S)-S-oxide reductase